MGAIVVDGVAYGKPNMANLEGDLGRRIIETILATPPSDTTELDRRCEQVSRRMREARADGTF